MLKALVLSGDGINCENETAKALELAGFQVDIIHINELIENKNQLREYKLLALPGGFSFGDEIHSGKVLSLKLKHQLGEELKEFWSRDTLTIGICNGFQTLAQLNVFTRDEDDFFVRLIDNECEHFINFWAELKKDKNNPSPWLAYLGETFSLPIRHGEGNFKTFKNKTISKESLQILKQRNQIALRYKNNPNGSLDDIAGIVDESGKILGLMPHPEASVKKETAQDGVSTYGIDFFKSAYQYFQTRE